MEFCIIQDDAEKEQGMQSSYKIESVAGNFRKRKGIFTACHISEVLNERKEERNKVFMYKWDTESCTAYTGEVMRKEGGKFTK